MTNFDMTNSKRITNSNVKRERVLKWDYDGMYGSLCAEISRGIELMCWGTEMPGFAILDAQRSRIWFRFEDRMNPVYQRIEKALRGGEAVRETLSALVMRRGGLDVRRDVDLVIGRARDGGIMLSAKPQRDDPIEGWAVSLDRDDAHRFANALALETPIQRQEYALKLEELRSHHNSEIDTEIAHARSR